MYGVVRGLAVVTLKRCVVEVVFICKDDLAEQHMDVYFFKLSPNCKPKSNENPIFLLFECGRPPHVQTKFRLTLFYRGTVAAIRTVIGLS